MTTSGTFFSSTARGVAGGTAVLETTTEARTGLQILAVFDADLTGRPHVYCLVHETNPSRPILNRELDDSWGKGFTRFSLLKWDMSDQWPLGAITNVTKAIASHRQGRICASLDYSPRRNIPKTERVRQLKFQL